MAKRRKQKSKNKQMLPAVPVVIEYKYNAVVSLWNCAGAVLLPGAPLSVLMSIPFQTVKTPAPFFAYARRKYLLPRRILITWYFVSFSKCL